MPLACTAPPILPATKTTNGTRATSRAIEQQQQQRRRSHVRNSAAAAAAAAEAATSVSGEQAAAQGGPSSSTVAAILLFVLILPAAPDPAAAAAATGAHHNATTPLSLLNPWLSACDIADPATAPDLRGSCSARDAMPSLSDNNHYSNNYDSGVNKQRNNNSSSNYGRDTQAAAAAAAAAVEAEMTTGRLNGQVSEGPGPPCGGGGGADRECLCGGVRLDECCGRAPLDALKPEARAAALRGPAAACRAHLRALARLDALAATLACKFDELLRRYDCAQDYSVSFGCAHCQVGRSVARVPRRAAPRRTRAIDPPRRAATLLHVAPGERRDTPCYAPSGEHPLQSANPLKPRVQRLLRAACQQCTGVGRAPPCRPGRAGELSLAEPRPPGVAASAVIDPAGRPLPQDQLTLRATPLTHCWLSTLNPAHGAAGGQSALCNMSDRYNPNCHSAE
ncbi:uncharacterized protein LOC126455949 [Schistocerca serialis cubense]|uniref:uncharacterized protein LOC126455949 n=1 Tax=Schistocerca serialis cubense TaxID=2023355 RepID=UPI00214EB1D5|nr:uncharacterized protein LOC126455949 [Schistocerca serialis cubense]